MTKEFDIENLINVNCRLLILLGMVTPLLLDFKDSKHKSEHYKIDWVLDALNAVVYENKPLPPFPERVLL
jgi:hypothetical protein